MNATENEHWLPVPGWKGLYDVSDRGRVRRRERRIHVLWKGLPHVRVLPEIILRPFLSMGNTGHDYWTVDLRMKGRDGKTRRELVAVHRIVLRAFCGAAAGRIACHGPAGAHVNTPQNLRWCDYTENLKDRLYRGY